MHWLLALWALSWKLSGPPNRAEPPTAAPGCAIELEAMRFVPAPQGSRLPLYADQKLATYLTQAYHRARPTGPDAPPAVLPLYAAQPLIFWRGNYLFVTTGLLAAVDKDAGLIAEFRELLPRPAPRRHGQSPPSSCGPMLLAGEPDTCSATGSFHALPGPLAAGPPALRVK
ncbi:MAG: hypothetical protein JST11_19810 [Acidobacteria bacterium]|nr:hypothetical protein [Acidobacteriota bacterium]